MTSWYFWLNLSFLGLAALIVLAAWPYRPKSNKWWWLLAPLLGATLIFDTILTRLPIVYYDATRIAGLHIGSIPIEDFAYTIAAVLLIPVVWRLLDIRTSDRLHWREVFIASRPVSWINTAAPFLAGAWLAFHQLNAPLIIGVIYFLIPYNLALYGINDIYDYESDMKNPRKGGIEGGIMPPVKHRQLWLWIIALNLPFLAYLFTTGSGASHWWLVFSLFMLVAYSLKGLRFKEIPLLDSLTSSIHFWSPLVYGTLLGGAVVNYRPALAAFILWGMASQAFGAVQDIAYDKAAGIGSIATTLGERGTAYFALICYGLAALLPILGFGWVGLVPGLALLAYVINVLVAAFSSGPVTLRYRRGWRVFMRLNIGVGFIITICLIIALNPFRWDFLGR